MIHEKVERKQTRSSDGQEREREKSETREDTGLINEVEIVEI
jgi:hypothetical protein